MTTAYWCILIAALLPYLWVTDRQGRRASATTIAIRAAGRRARTTRAASAPTPRSSMRFEAFAPFAASVLMAQAADVDPARIAQLAIAFVVLRVLHGLFYIGNIHALRSLAWFGGFAWWCG